MIPIKVSNIDKLASDHADLILKDYCDDLDVNAIDNLLTPYRFKDILIAKPTYLLNAIIYLVKKTKGDFSSLLSVYDKFAEWKTKKYCAEKLVKNLGLVVCPYCNRTFIHSIDERKSRVCQIDHFFSKKDYPYLSLSFYNLIPSCYACNHTKSIHKLGISPYELNNSESVTFSYVPVDTTHFDVTLKVNNIRMERNADILGLRNLYSYHGDLVDELVDKRKIYTDDYLEELQKNFGDVIESKEQLLRLIAGNYIQEDDLKKRPLAKLTRDIMLQLDFIKKE